MITVSRHQEIFKFQVFVSFNASEIDFNLTHYFVCTIPDTRPNRAHITFYRRSMFAFNIVHRVTFNEHNQVFCFISEQRAIMKEEKERKKQTKLWTNIELLDSDDDYYFRLMMCLWIAFSHFTVFPAWLKWLIGISARIHQYIWHFTSMMRSVCSFRKKNKERKTERREREREAKNTKWIWHIALVICAVTFFGTFKLHVMQTHVIRLCVPRRLLVLSWSEIE